MSEHPCRLRSLELRNFKSIAHGRVDFKALTVIVGKNSSGKSSLLQAIRLLAQAARSNALGSEFPLNGKSVQMGTFQATRTFGTEGSEVTLQMTVAAADDSDDALTWALQIAPPDHETSGSGRISSVRIEAVPGDSSSRAGRRASLSCQMTQVESDPSLWRRTPVGQDVVSPSYWETLLKDQHPAPNCAVAGCLTSGDRTAAVQIQAAEIAGGLPRRLFVADDENTLKLGNRWWRETWSELIGVFAPSPQELRSHGDDHLADLVDRLFNDQMTPDALASDDRQSLSEHLFGAHAAEPVDPGTAVRCAAESLRYAYGEDTTNDEEQGALGEQVGFDLQTKEDRLRSYWHGLALDERARVGIAMSRLDRGEFVRLLALECGADDWAGRPVFTVLESEATESLNNAVSAIEKHFSANVRYLGPLRRPPDAFGDRGEPDRLDAGAAGENVAAILYTHAHRRVSVPWQDGKPRLMTLERALQYWLARLELADSVKVDDMGRFGLGLQVVPQDMGRPVDLTSVGVGVSQVVPLLVQCLLTEPGDLVILEQPELHLHPALQMKVADFLLACACSGRQLIVETHSEYLVNRLRRWVAEDDSDQLRSLVGLLFAQRDDDRPTTLRASDINPMGGLSEDWPDGFLDVGARDGQQLLLAGLDKHRRRKKQ